jgi:hypothetical protein
MKYYCPICKKLVGDITGMVRKRAEILCGECIERLKIADDMARLAREQSRSSSDYSMPPFFKDFFGKEH